MTDASLAHDAFGSGEPLVVLHGLFGSARNWQSIARRMANRYRVITVDLRNHGRSDWAETMTYSDMVDDLRELLEDLGLERVHLLGHSAGGKVAMMFSLLYGQMIDSLCVVDIAPVAYTHGDSFVPYITAMQALDLSGRRKRGELVDELAQRIEDEPLARFLGQNLSRVKSSFTWRINLRVIREYLDDLTGFPDVGELSYDGPTIFISGNASDYVKPQYHDAALALFPAATFEVIAHAGHRVHADQPARFTETVVRFLAGGNR